jgi:hypothetical protein
MSEFSLLMLTIDLATAERERAAIRLIGGGDCAEDCARVIGADSTFASG